MQYTKADIAAAIRKMRASAGLTQKEVAVILGKTPQLVGHWETGYSQPDIDTFLEFCKLCETDINKALKTAEQKEPATGEGDGLNAREHELIRLFRLIPEDRQEFVLRMVEAALDKQAL